jgi:KipI family sensor histidine kinase inhibitor
LKNKGLRSVRSAGDDLLSVPAPSTRHAQALAASLRVSGEWLEAVAGIDSVVVRYDLSRVTRADAERRLADAGAAIRLPAETKGRVVEIPIAYGGAFGPDLEMVCEKLGMGEDEFVALHTGEYTVDMLGFIPGFAYVGGLDKRLIVPRLPEPRQHVAAGSVGIAGGRSGIYSLPGPGGWPLIGRTSRKLFDSVANEPFTLAAGMTVIFAAVDAL